MANSVEDLVNQALVEIGYPERIASIEEGSKASIAALEVYGQTRDELLDIGEWPLARRANIPLVLLKGPPPAGGYNPTQPWSVQYPPPGWLYEYAYPDDMLNLGAILPPPSLMFEMDPKPATWRVDNDNSLIDRNGAATVQTKVILSNVKGALAVYIGQVTDPALWEPGFTSLVVRRLGEKLARALGMGEVVARQELAEGAMLEPGAEGARG